MAGLSLSELAELYYLLPSHPEHDPYLGQFCRAVQDASTLHDSEDEKKSRKALERPLQDSGCLRTDLKLLMCASSRAWTH